MQDKRNDEKRLRLKLTDQAVLLRALACYLETVPEPKTEKWCDADYRNYGERGNITSLAWAIGTLNRVGRRRQFWGTRQADSEWCRRRAKEIETGPLEKDGTVTTQG